jgi:SecD/SecF fusion protein
MKTILYILIAIIIGSIVLPVIPIQGFSQTTLVIKARGTNVKASDFQQSAAIISARMTSFTGKDVKTTLLADKYEIKLSIQGKWNQQVLEQIATRKGELNFYECYTIPSLLDLFSGNSYLLSLAKKTIEENPKDIEMMNVTTEESNRVSNELNSLNLPDSIRFAWADTDNSGADLFCLRIKGNQSPVFQNKAIESMQVKEEGAGDQAQIEIRFSENAKSTWAEATRRNMNNSIALVLDKTVIFAPKIRSVIENGNSMITGNFTKDEMNFIVALGANGELPVDFELVK